MNIFVLALGLAFDAAAYMAELDVYLLRFLFVTTVQAAICLCQAVDRLVGGLIGDFELSSNPIFRAVVVGVAGFLLALLAGTVIAVSAGHWEIPFCSSLIVIFSLIIGLVADPDREWSVGDFPRWGDRGGPRMPLNL